jgi:hypothetical protein
VEAKGEIPPRAGFHPFASRFGQPGLSEHRCSKGYAGGFVGRLNGGAYFSHTVEQVTPN